MFLMEYLQHPRTVGAIAPSSGHLAEKMVQNIDFSKAECIVEYGPGTGIFTEKILARVSEDTKVILVEINSEFYQILKERYKNKKNVVIVNGSAENIDQILQDNEIEHVDYVLSGLPFASLPYEMTQNILGKTAELLKDKGTFITFQYSLVKLRMFQQFFGEIGYKKVYRNIPPAYVLQLQTSR